MPSFPQAAVMAAAGCACRVESGPATTPWAPISASQVRPSSSALALLITTTAAAPSEICEDEPAVIVPFLSKAGRSRPRLSAVVSARMPSSSLKTTGSPLRCGISTGTTSSSNSPFFQAAAARWWDRAEKASWSSREMPSSALHASVRAPIAWVVEDVPEAVVGHVVDELHVAELHALTGLRQEVRCLGHRLHAARDDDLELAGPDELVGQGDGVDAGQTDLVDGQRGHGHRDAGLDGGLPRRDLPRAGLQHLAHDHVVDLLRRHAGLLQRPLDRDPAEVSGREVLERAEEPPHRRPGSRDDDGSSHGATSCSTSGPALSR